MTFRELRVEISPKLCGFLWVTPNRKSHRDLTLGLEQG